MDAQALLVRCCKLGLKQSLLVVTKRDRHAMLFVKRATYSLLTLVSVFFASDLHAQNWGPGPNSQFAQHGDPYAHANPSAYAELVPDDRLNSFSLDTPLHNSLSNHVSGSWIRMEYFHAKIGHRGGRSLGSTITDLDGNVIDNVSEPFDLPMFPTQGLPITLTGRAVAPTTDGTDWDDNNGIKGSFGIPLDQRSSIEGSVWSLEEQAESLRVPSIPPTSLNSTFGVAPVQFIVIPFTIDGQPGTIQNLPNLPTVPAPFADVPLIVYDSDFFSEYSVNVWSAEVNHVYDLRIPHDGWTLQSIIGYRHEEYSERLVFGGTFSNVADYATDGTINANPLTTPQTNRIDSKVHNYRNALQFGLRSEVKQKRLTLGVEPKVALGLGLIRSRVKTQNAREPGDLSSILNDPNLLIDDPASTTDFDRELDFAPSAELNVYAKCDVTEWFKLRVGYNLTWMGRVGAADTSIRYNTISAADPTMNPDTLDFGVKQNVNNRIISGLTIGGEILLP